MARKPLSADQRAEGERLAAFLKQARVRLQREQAAIARSTGVSLDHIRALEGGRISTPSFVTVARIARQLELGLDSVADETIRD